MRIQVGVAPVKFQGTKYIKCSSGAGWLPLTAGLGVCCCMPVCTRGICGICLSAPVYSCCVWLGVCCYRPVTRMHPPNWAACIVHPTNNCTVKPYLIGTPCACCCSYCVVYCVVCSQCPNPTHSMLLLCAWCAHSVWCVQGKIELLRCAHQRSHLVPNS